VEVRTGKVGPTKVRGEQFELDTKATPAKYGKGGLDVGRSRLQAGHFVQGGDGDVLPGRLGGHGAWVRTYAVRISAMVARSSGESRAMRSNA
jgi:hypothetical protein